MTFNLRWDICAFSLYFRGSARAAVISLFRFRTYLLPLAITWYPLSDRKREKQTVQVKKGIYLGFQPLDKNPQESGGGRSLMASCSALIFLLVMSQEMEWKEEEDRLVETMTLLAVCSLAIMAVALRCVWWPSLAPVLCLTALVAAHDRMYWSQPCSTNICSHGKLAWKSKGEWEVREAAAFSAMIPWELQYKTTLQL